MAFRRIRFYETWDFESIRASIVVIFIIVLFCSGYYLYPKVHNYFKLMKYDSVTKGKILSVEEHVFIRQTQLGSKPKVGHYKVSFSYDLEGQVYVVAEDIAGTIGNRKSLRLILNSDSIANVKYMSEYPRKSVLDLTE